MERFTPTKRSFLRKKRGSPESKIPDGGLPNKHGDPYDFGGFRPTGAEGLGPQIDASLVAPTRKKKFTLKFSGNWF